MSNLVFVHGTGVRRETYRATYKTIKEKLPLWRVFPCFWGNKHGVELRHRGASIPGYQAEEDLTQENREESQWELLYRDPLCELRRLGTPVGGQIEIPFGEVPEWESLKERIEGFEPDQAMKDLLREGELLSIWVDAFRMVVKNEVFLNAIRNFKDETDQTIPTIARGLVAGAIAIGLSRGLPLPDADVRDTIVDRLTLEFGAKTYRDWKETLVTYYIRPLTWYAERDRAVVSDAAFPFAGDILLYQRRGDEIRTFIENRILRVSRRLGGAKVVLLAHSLGGIACFDLMARKPELPVKALVTVGSQAPLLYEMDCLESLRWNEALRKNFPPWLNVYDRQDLLSYIAQSLFPGQAEDFEIKSGQPFPVSHGAYWKRDELWRKVEDFTA